MDTHFAGKKEGARQERDSRKHARNIEEDRRLHDLSTKLADQYVEWATMHRDSGPHALARLGLHFLGYDERIRKAIAEMDARTGQDPWRGSAPSVENVDLVKFFQHVADNNVDFFHAATVETVAGAVGERRVGAADELKA